MFRALLRYFLTLLAHLLKPLLFDLTVTGWEHLPERGPLILISNHFSWFEVFLITLCLPYQPVFFAAAELRQHPILRLIAAPFEFIPVHRGQADRVALRRALQVLEEGKVLLIFPEGGIDPDLIDEMVEGRSVDPRKGRTSRLSAQLIRARPGAAFLAVRSQAPILPVAFLGTEQVQANLKRWRRTPVSMRIGPVFGPLTLEAELRGRARRRRLDELGDVMMGHIAALLPPENRGPYA